MACMVIGLGANLGDREKNIKRALEALSLLKDTTIIKASRIYETSPVGFKNQPDFLNCAVELNTKFSPKAVLGACMGIEAAMGRIRGIKDGPRIIDLDLLLYEGVNCNDGELILPHPRIPERVFVLLPLLDLFPNKEAYGYPFCIPGNKLDKIVLFTQKLQPDIKMYAKIKKSE